MTEIKAARTKPQPSGEISFSLPSVEKFKPDNELEVMFVRRTNLPVVQFTLLSNAGNKFDPEDKKGLANLMGMLIDEGAGGMDALQLNEEIDLLGSNVSIRVDEDSFFISLLTLKNNLTKSFELYSKIITQPHFDEKSFQREQRKILTRVLQIKDQPDEIADLIAEYSVFGKSSPYAYDTRGNEESLQNITPAGVKDYYKKLLKPNNSTLIVVGDITTDELKDLLNENLTEWKPGDISGLYIPDAKREKSRIILCHKENAVQSEIRAAHSAPKRDEGNFFASLLMNLILGGQFSSRINLNLREAKGYTYGATSRIYYFRQAAYFCASTSVATENTGNTIKEILFELNRIKEGVTSEELDFAKSSVIRKFPMNFETNAQIASNLSSKVIHSLPDDYFDQYIDNIKNVTPEDIRNAALSSIFPEEINFIIVGDKNKILPQLKNFTDMEIVEVDEKGKYLSKPLDKS
jgi:zinc protease